MLVEVPDHLTDKVEGIVQKELSRLSETDRLNTEEDISWWIEKHVHEDESNLVVRRSVYGDKSVALYRMIVPYNITKINDPPVIMKGSRYACWRRYDHRGGNSYRWAERVIGRYVRMKKVTSIGYDKEWKSLLKYIDRKIEEKWGWWSLKWIKYDLPNPDYWAYIEGKRTYFDPKYKAAMRSLMKNLHKVNDIDAACRQLEWKDDEGLSDQQQE